MKKVIVAAVLLLLLAVSGFAETGIGATALLPAWMFYDSPDEFQLNQLFVGGSLRSKHSIFLVDVSALYYLNSPALAGFADAGVCLDLFIFRLSLVGGIQGLFFLESDENIFALNGKANVDVKIGPISVGLSLTAPLYHIGADEQPQWEDMFVYLGGLSLNLLFWF